MTYIYICIYILISHHFSAVKRHRLLKFTPREWVGVGGFSKVVATFNHVGGSINLFMATIWDVWIIPSFQIWDYVLHVEYVSCVVMNCGQHQWVIPSPLNISLGFAGGKHCQKITIPIFRLVLQNFAIPGCFPYIFFSRAIFSPYFPLVGSLLQSVALFQSKEVVK